MAVCGYQRPKISLVVHDLSEGFGQGRYCIELIRRLGERFSFTVISASADTSIIAGVNWVKVPAWRRSALTTVFSFRRNVRRYLAPISCDLVHSQGMTGGVPDVVTAHVCNAARLKQLGNSAWRSALFTRLVVPFERAYFRQAGVRRVIAISQVVAEEVRVHGYWRGPMAIIPHGTDTTRFRPGDGGERGALRRKYGIRDNDWLWLFMGEAEKGLAETLRRMPDFPNARLMVVTRSRMEPFRRLAADLAVVDRVVFHGPEPRPELCHRVADVFVYPSRYDTFGLVVTEAMATGVPVVVGKNVGAAELIIDGVNGLLCDPDSERSLTAALRQLNGDPARARQFGTSARQAIEKNTWAECAEATAKVYEEVLSEKRTVTGQ